MTSSATAVVLNVPNLTPEKLAPAVSGFGDAVELIGTDYSLGDDVRANLARDPNDPAMIAQVPPLTTEQKSTFAKANVVFGLDLPLDLPLVAPELEWVQSIGSGLDLCVSAGLVDSNVKVTNAAGIGAPTIAEFVLARLLEHWKRLPEINANQQAAKWSYTFGSEVAGKRVAVIGLGEIGSAVARLCRALGMHVTGTRRSYSAGDTDDRVDELRGAADLADVLSTVDAVVLCATGVADNESMFSTAEFNAMSENAIFVNVSRGMLVDEDALISALASSSIAAAAIDVTREEPLPSDSPLWATPNLAISPHSSPSMDGYFEKVIGLFLENLGRFIGGQPLRNQVDLRAAGYGS